ncbi:uncharacterized protein N7503_006706 [Penicillium pulvis]|uniref:uncharacterized protein n=1 Tax=Penicillium pulvis TaxID=1562058 RepID=UPI002547170E|nr:uncharacterized protein N7503_006706 [Penicillium pulvis]KAJ5797410.1 hypothetical protein N7503_006706 [Penicillium pulvis]
MHAENVLIFFGSLRTLRRAFRHLWRRESQEPDAPFLKIDDDPSIQAVDMHDTSLQVFLALYELGGSQWTIDFELPLRSVAVHTRVRHA